MEEYDDLSQGPNNDGSFNLSYNDFHTIPYDLCQDYHNRLIYLNLSHNKIVEITDQIGSLTLLKEINLSHNALKLIHIAIGKCIRLRKIDFSHNQLLSIPAEVISKCSLMVGTPLQNIFCLYNVMISYN